MVASELGNTPIVGKNYYIHPPIFNKIDQQMLPVPNPFKSTKSVYKLSASEKLALEIIKKASTK